MKEYTVKVSGLIVLAVMAITMSGCGCYQKTKADQPVSNFELSSNRNVKILWADSHREGDNIIVHGTFKRAVTGSAPMKVHIDVQVLSQQGDLLQEFQTPELTVPSNLPGKGNRYERIEIELTDIPVENPTVVLSAHQGGHDV